ncbi:Nuclease-related domain-containing protein [Methanosarcina thermophila]|uniref:Nuclease-related domain-containing protein n=3 Tax=Methanosarcina thermophila TaxID=2210 RepID=A0A1I6ZHQ2_METTE|nr:nuclease-related domain-containing protein [Methanosarcina thermophila]ALK04880.1 MAG: hypothetical protein AAY43_03200 [Methanosarcina sp. 795]AKB13599.1 hypothetical protein MSTHT_1841 [Methanosarcina thermophila TM-1]AKB15763.1 hypothetical protein MSTHC_1445 [Methanosarcina thermophila CHTI-55]NLU56760.1 hypothetical protein [Methanosarcina thermophila]SFT62209.1 Nuclease-related domain-containing protein [Methanosarcina thermophila]
MRYSAECDKIETEIKELETEIGNLEREIESRSLEIKNNISQRIKDLESEIYELENIRFSLSSLFSYLRAKLALYNKTRLIQDLRLNPQKEINKLLREEYSEFQDLNNRYAYLKSNKNEEIERWLQPLSENLERINKIKSTNEYKGAIGELEVIKNLENLSESYFLLNDLFLELDEYITFQGSKLKSAQIDHLVVGPTGVYVIEVKNWSYEYVQKVFRENSYTPYDQIQRSSYLTYRYLNNLKYGNMFQKIYFRLAKDEIEVKSIIAVTGADIPYIKEKHTAVVRSNELSDYIKRGYQILSPDEAREIAEKLSYRVL